MVQETIAFPKAVFEDDIGGKAAVSHSYVERSLSRFKQEFVTEACSEIVDVVF